MAGSDSSIIITGSIIIRSYIKCPLHIEAFTLLHRMKHLCLPYGFTFSLTNFQNEKLHAVLRAEVFN